MTLPALLSYVERDWLDYAGFIFNALATSVGVVGFFIAIKAYKIAKEQGRKTFELELLRELNDSLEREISDDGSHSEIPEPTIGQISRLAMLPTAEFTLWHAVHKFHDQGESKAAVLNHPLVSEAAEAVGMGDPYSVVVGAMFMELQIGMDKRVE